MTILFDPQGRTWGDRVEEFDKRCVYCLKKSPGCGPLTMDHVVPKQHGGQDSYDNLVPACISCNHDKSGKSLKQYAEWLRLEGRDVRFHPKLMTRLGGKK